MKITFYLLLISLVLIPFPAAAQRRYVQSNDGGTILYPPSPSQKYEPGSTTTILLPPSPSLSQQYVQSSPQYEQSSPRTILLSPFPVKVNTQKHAQNNYIDFHKFDLSLLHAYNSLSIGESSHLFYVRVENDELVVTQNTYTEENVSYKLHDGLLIGVRGKEQTQQLLFLDDEGIKGSVIKKGYIESIFSVNNKIYFYEKLLVNKKSSGTLYELREFDGEFFYREVYNFKNMPYSITAIHGNIVVLTHNALYELHPDGTWITLVQNAPWRDSPPTSLAVYNQENIYMGLRGGFLKIDVDRRELTLYRYIE